jgi:PAS domain S-box-containing protein
MDKKKLYKFEELVDIKSFQTLLDKLNAIDSFSSAILDLEGNILVATAWQDICTKFHRVNPQSEVECIKSEKYIHDHLDEADPAVSYRCPHGLIDNAIPIIIDGQHLATFFIGQFFLESPEIDFFKQQATKYGFNEKEYLEAVSKVSIWSEEKLKNYLAFFKQLTESLAQTGLNHLKEIQNRKLIAEQKKEIQESSEKFIAFTNQSNEGITMTDMNGNYLFVNPGFCKMSGYSEEELLKLSVLDMRPENQTSNSFQQIKTQKEGLVVEVNLQRKDNTQYLADIIGTIITIGDKQFVLGTIRDISPRKRVENERAKLEEQLQQSQKMEAVGTLAGGIAHDFNNIIGVISGFTELTMDDLSDPEEVLENLQQVMDAANRAQEMVAQILTFSRKTGRNMGGVDMSMGIKETLKFLRSAIPSTIEIKQNIEKDLGLIYGNPIQINQVLMNLCTNAAHAMKENGGVLEINLKKCVITNDSPLQEIKPGIYQQLIVSDSGHGMSKEVLERIYEPYFTTKEKEEGSGMGLAVIYGIVNSHKGAIEVSSNVGIGTTFSVYFPLMESSEVIKPVSDLESFPRGNNEMILFLDDEPALVKVGTKVLKRLGYRVESRVNSIKALEAFKTSPDDFDIIITDMTMPNMTGVVFAKEVHQIRPEIPVVICTGFSGDINNENFKQYGINAFLMKPITKKVLSETLHNILQNID